MGSRACHENQSNMSEEVRSDISIISDKINELKTAVEQAVVGQTEMIDQMLICLLANGHALIEGVPGIAKTLSAKALSSLIDSGFGRIQFTSDLMPSDVIGTSIFNLKSNEFEFKQGPVFTEVLLIDEINRAPAKTQAALFEVMEEKQISVDGTTYPLSDLFFVLATQNPIEQEGTYRLPEAQLDRFLFKIIAEYPTEQEEVGIMKLHEANKPTGKLKAILKSKDLLKVRAEIQKVIIEDKLLNYIAAIVNKTRNSSDLYLGASPRASIGIMQSAKVKAVMSGRDFVIPEDIQYVAYPVLRHRLILSPEREMEGLTSDEIIRMVVEQIEVPR